MRRKWIWVLTIILGATMLWAVLPRLATADDTDIVLSEVLYNAHCISNGSDICGNGGSEDHFEWVEIYNRGPDPVSLNGWQICDMRPTSTCRMIPAATIGSHEVWVIGYNAIAMQNELAATGHSSAWNASRFIALNNPIGDGLTNGATFPGDPEGVYLLNASSIMIDCVSWSSTAGTACGPEGVNTTLSNSGQAVSIANIQGTWYFHGPGDASAINQSSPFDANNVASGGIPTIIGLQHLTANSDPSIAAPLVVFGIASIGGLVIAIRRRRAVH